ncbi:type II toxin-antitoxin system VapC family toxin [Georgenia thermotolerans]|uniref:Ribonuclease VapC n=1 Tax=Georgenia thermotolerans TaxID=527326 RepID=A0A7J5UJE1_9MICO|nr:type II toxin-antitoxin system VapC family toxin [Georgenia thermotolerans]KAE8762492.1 PIN domain-containing protein [Georgenia thermotolerans]
MAHYLDTSALVKLVVAEEESAALFAWSSDQESGLVSSDLARTELVRVVRRAAPDLMGRARAVLDTLVLLTLPTSTFEEAGRLGPPGLHSLDVLHLAAALRLGDDLEALVTYDDRLAGAAGALAIPVLSPGHAHRGPPA